MIRTTATSANRVRRAEAGLKRMFDRLAAEPVPTAMLGLVAQLEGSAKDAG